ncbi:MAG: AAA family ATPase [Saprospiraceae bacterium]|nr:AAA family ATPase [Saprospiraceae bacterium]
MAISQQRLQKIYFGQLKNLRDFTLDLEPNNVTGIFGVNGCGKSSIIYSLLSLFKPSEREPDRYNYKFSQFFTHTNHTRFLGSNFEITHTFRQDQTAFQNILRKYEKADRWKPRYENRPERDVYFIGINTSVPEIETEKSESIIRFQTVPLNDALSNEIKANAEIVLNRQYTEFNNHPAKRKSYIGVRHNNIPYSSLAMGAGEQRVFKILSTVFKAERHSLIIIDEIDLTLHTDALNRLINILVNRAIARNLQIIFTSHREELTKRTDINIRHIHQTAQKTICFNQTNPDCISRLTGQQITTLEIFVEDDLSELIAHKVIEELNIRRHCSIRRFGAIDNGFSLATGLYLKGENLENMRIILDGDRYKLPAEKMTQMEKYFSGNEPQAVTNRTNALSCIGEFTINTAETPEQFINRIIREINDNSEIVNVAMQINAVADKHDYINQVIALLGYQDKTIGLTRVVEKLSQSVNWNDYTRELRDWLQGRIAALNL